MKKYLNSPDDRIVLKLLPVPFAGEWEVRISYMRNFYHFYMSNSKYGYKEDLGIKDYYSYNFWHSEWEPEYDNNPIIYLRPDSLLAMEHDKQCREHDIMKLPYGFGAFTRSNVYRSARCLDSPSIFTPNEAGKYPSTIPYRFIVYQGYMEPDKEYWLHVHAIGNPHIHWDMDLIELVPRSVYANPDKREDWW